MTTHIAYFNDGHYASGENLDEVKQIITVYVREQVELKGSIEVTGASRELTGFLLDLQRQFPGKFVGLARPAFGDQK